jgi:hypothetical protein
MAVDWGRWIYIHFMMLLFLSTLLLDKRTPEIHSETDDEYIRIPLLWPAKSSFLRRANTTVLCLMAIAYIMLWYMPHFGHDPVFSLNGNFYRIKHFFTGYYVPHP